MDKDFFFLIRYLLKTEDLKYIGSNIFIFSKKKHQMLIINESILIRGFLNGTFVFQYYLECCTVILSS